MVYKIQPYLIKSFSEILLLYKNVSKSILIVIK